MQTAADGVSSVGKSLLVRTTLKERDAIVIEGGPVKTN